jgi:hypothetical protein
MKNIYLLFCLFCISAFSQNVTITKVIETGCSSPFVKTVELYVDGTVDFENDDIVLNYMQNGDPWQNIQIDISGLGLQTDAFVYIVRDIPLMQAEFPSTIFDASNTIEVGTSTSGDDGYQLVLNGTVISQFGKTETDADDDTESNWNHNDAVATRLDGITDTGTWDPAQWSITAENDLDDHTACQENGASPNLETYFGTLGSTFPLGSGSGWTPVGDVCTIALGSTSVTCATFSNGDSDDTYTATLDFIGGNNDFIFVVNSTAGTVGGDDPSNIETGTIVITNIPEGIDITVSLSDIADGGICDLSEDISSPGCVPLVLNEVLFDPPSDDDQTTEIEGDANNDGTRDASEDEFMEFFNNSNEDLNISGYTIFDSNALSSDTPRHVVPANTIISANSAYVVFGGGTPTGSFGTAIVQTASSGDLNLTNSGDDIIVKNSSGLTVIDFDSDDLSLNFGDNQSITRSPDITGDYVLHTDANADLVFSPGLQVDGTTLSIQDNRLKFDITFYPNPVKNGFVNINSKTEGTKTIELYDLTGRLVMSTKLDTSILDVSSIGSGIYLLKVTISNRTSTNKLIID